MTPIKKIFFMIKYVILLLFVRIVSPLRRGAGGCSIYMIIPMILVLPFIKEQKQEAHEAPVHAKGT